MVNSCANGAMYTEEKFLKNVRYYEIPEEEEEVLQFHKTEATRGANIFTREEEVYIDESKI